MHTPHIFALKHYQTPAFAEKHIQHSRENYDAAHQSLREIFEELRAAYRKLAPEQVQPVPLSHFIEGPLSIEHLIAMIRTYARKLSVLLS